MMPSFLYDRAKSALPGTPLPSEPSWSTASAEGAEEGVARFTSLVRDGDYLPISQVLVNECH